MDTLEETLSELDVGEGKPLGVSKTKQELRAQGLDITGKPLPPTKVAFDHNGYQVFQRKSLESKREYLKQQWLNVGYLTLSKAELFSRSVTKKDFGKLVQILMSAGISWDKVFPKVDTGSGNSLVLNLFNGLPKDDTLRVIADIPTPSEKVIPTGKPLGGQATLATSNGDEPPVGQVKTDT
jgi:hypothetical protein